MLFTCKSTLLSEILILLERWKRSLVHFNENCRSECVDAIGERDGSVQKPTWGGFYNRKDAEKCLEIVQHVKNTSRFTNPQRAQAVTQHLPTPQQPSLAPPANINVQQVYTICTDLFSSDIHEVFLHIQFRPKIKLLGTMRWLRWSESWALTLHWLLVPTHSWTLSTWTASARDVLSSTHLGFTWKHSRTKMSRRQQAFGLDGKASCEFFRILFVTEGVTDWRGNKCTPICAWSFKYTFKKLNVRKAMRIAIKFNFILQNSFWSRKTKFIKIWNSKYTLCRIKFE